MRSRFSVLSPSASTISTVAPRATSFQAFTLPTGVELDPAFIQTTTIPCKPAISRARHPRLQTRTKRRKPCGTGTGQMSLDPEPYCSSFDRYGALLTYSACACPRPPVDVSSRLNRAQTQARTSPIIPCCRSKGPTWSSVFALQSTNALVNRQCST